MRWETDWRAKRRGILVAQTLLESSLASYDWGVTHELLHIPSEAYILYMPTSCGLCGGACGLVCLCLCWCLALFAHGCNIAEIERCQALVDRHRQIHFHHAHALMHSWAWSHRRELTHTLPHTLWVSRKRFFDSLQFLCHRVLVVLHYFSVSDFRVVETAAVSRS